MHSHWSSTQGTNGYYTHPKMNAGPLVPPSLPARCWLVLARDPLCAGWCRLESYSGGWCRLWAGRRLGWLALLALSARHLPARLLAAHRCGTGAGAAPAGPTAGATRDKLIKRRRYTKAGRGASWEINRGASRFTPCHATPRRHVALLRGVQCPAAWAEPEAS